MRTWSNPKCARAERPLGGVANQTLFIFEDPSLEKAVGKVLHRMPALQGAPLRIRSVGGLRDGRGAVHAASFLRQRTIAFDCTGAEFPRVFAHELFHFAWVRLGNPGRLSWEVVLRRERRAGARGELGWSAEWRQHALRAGDPGSRSRRWRDYCCESFCDTGAWLYSGVGRHEEFTLPEKFRSRRRDWFREAIEPKRLPL